MRLVRFLVLLTLLGLPSYWAWTNIHLARDFVETFFESGEFLTLESRFTPEQIMRTHQHELVTDSVHTFQPPTVQYHPYLLMEVKFSQDDRTTEEAVLMWGLNDGEMVLDTADWTTSHGFEDCLRAHADGNDYKIINALAGNKGVMGRKSLLAALGIKPDTLDSWVKQTRDKKLIVQRGKDYRLHFGRPRLPRMPRTHIRQRLVTRPYKHATRIAKRYSRSQIERNAQAAFGPDFAIRRHQEVFLPVYTIEIKNPDGSVATTLWNALTGEQMEDGAIR